MKEAFKENWRPGRFLLSLFGALIMVSALFIYQFTATAENAENETNYINPGPELIDSTLGLQSKDIFFDYESDAIREDAKPVLAENAEILKLNPDMFVIIEGEWDINETGGKVLAELRAHNVRDFIVRQGIEPGRILTSSKCKQHEQMVSNTAEYQELNRRVHFISIELDQQGFASLDNLLTTI
jgi:outer membrane protein OmpA-like peptidoglycan-associated protein